MSAVKHGHWKGGKRSPTYVSWASMCARCRREKHPRYEDYGGRGVTVHVSWIGRGGFARFLAHIGERPQGMTLDRIDPNGNYEPGNVQWATPLQQRWNRRDMVGRQPPHDEPPAEEEEWIDPDAQEDGIPF